jgi:hypothetical protein
VPVTITSTGVGAICAVLTLVGGFGLWLVRMIVRADNDRLLQRINGTYVRSAGSPLTGHEIETRLVKLEARKA